MICVNLRVLSIISDHPEERRRGNFMPSKHSADNCVWGRDGPWIGYGEFTAEAPLGLRILGPFIAGIQLRYRLHFRKKIYS